MQKIPSILYQYYFFQNILPQLLADATNNEFSATKFGDFKFS